MLEAGGVKLCGPVQRAGWLVTVVFNSLEFFPFFLIVAVAYFACPSWPAKKLILVAASFFFYGWFNPWYVLLLGGATLFSWLVTEQMVRSRRYRRFWLGVAVTIPLSLLAYFKYAMFFQENVALLYDYWGMERGWTIMNVFLPVGISFYLFHTMSYMIDVYRGGQRANLLNYTLYIVFFPALVAGPIVRASDFLPQTKQPERGRPDWANINWGLCLLVFGLFQKVVLADRVFAGVSNDIFGQAASASFADAWLGSLAFTGQIFYDFAGYSTCAIGVALCFNYRIPINFHYPYAAIGFSDFWRRWHISLSSWLRDYLYISLGGNRKGKARTYVNLFLTMLLGGLWHGAAWTFVIWGALHGAYLVGERFARFLPIRSIALGWLATFLLTIIGWVFFRAETVSDAARLLSSMASPANLVTRVDATSALLVLAGMAGTLIYSAYMRNRMFADVWAALPLVLRGALIGGALFLVITWRGAPVEFIYFAF